MIPIDCDVAIIGSGCAGLWLAFELSALDYMVVIVEHGDLAGYASTGNQSWLHSGAFYAVVEGVNKIRGSSKSRGLHAIAQKCRSASEELRSFCPIAFEKYRDCLYIFEDLEEAQSARDQVNAEGLKCTLIKTGLEKIEPLLGRSLHKYYGLLTPDKAFNSEQFLSYLANLVSQRGVRFQRTAPITKLHLEKHEDRWRISDNANPVVRSKLLILASGAAMPDMLSRANPPINIEIPLQKSLVGVVHKRLCDRILSIRSEGAHGLSLAPFRDGTTVNLGAVDQPSVGSRDLNLAPEFSERLAETLKEYIPAALPCNIHFYGCQKVNNTEETSHPLSQFGGRHYWWFEPAKGLYCFYPGKFTLARMAAQEFISKNIAVRGELKAQGSKGDPPTVSKRPYFSRPSHRIDLGGNLLDL